MSASTETHRGSSQPVVVALGLGSNLGASEEALRLAADTLAFHLQEVRLSSPYSTQALCDSEQPRFLNAVLVASSRLDPEELLGLAKALEWMAGRRRGARNAPRPLDVDLLVYGDLRLERPEMTVPHPRIREREFVLAPLAEVAPDLPIPPDGSSAEDILAALSGYQDVVRSAWSPRSP